MRILVRASIGLISCCALLVSLVSAATAPDTDALDGTAWVLAAIDGRQASGSATATLQFESGRLSGSDGCNRFAGSYSASGSALEVSTQLASSQMACPERVANEARAFIAAVSAAERYRGGRRSRAW